MKGAAFLRDLRSIMGEASSGGSASARKPTAATRETTSRRAVSA
jgi:hypothetical protein